VVKNYRITDVNGELLAILPAESSEAAILQYREWESRSLDSRIRHATELLKQAWEDNKKKPRELTAQETHDHR
jgi:hypothetical protein